MSIAITNTQARSLKWIVAAAVVAVGALVAVSLLSGGHIQQASAVTPAEYGLTEGDVIRATAGNDPDVYIVNNYGYKRLFTNPAIFNVYQHIGWAKVKNVPNATRDAFMTSGLFRNCQTNDPNVYALDVASEDVGILHWLNITAEAAIAAEPQFAWKVFCINTAEMGLYSMGADYTAYSQVPNYNRFGATPTPTPVPGSVSVSLSSANPVARTVTTNAQGVEFLKVRLSGTGTVSGMTFDRTGPGSTDDFDNVYIYEGARRLVSGKSFNSSGTVTFGALNLAVSGTRDLTFVGDLSATAGNVNAIKLSAVTLVSGTVGGLTVMGNNVTVSGATSGTITLAKTGSLGNPNAGQLGVQISEFKLTANTEAASVKRIQMLQGGTMSTSNFGNLKIKAGTTEWPGTIDSAGYLVFDLGSGYTIDKGGNAIFKVYSDTLGKKDETVKVYIEYSTDVQAIGAQYGFGMAATITAMDTTAEAHALTLQGGVLTISFVGPSATTIGTDTDDTVFLRYTMNAARTLCHPYRC